MQDKKFFEIIDPSKTVLIIGSSRLDYDCIGSGLVLKKYLESLGKKVTFIFPTDISNENKKMYSFLPFFDEIVTGDSREALSKRNADVLILIDGSNFVQFYESDDPKKVPDLNIYPVRINIDHHLINAEKLGTYTMHYPKAAATVEIILEKIVPEEFIDKNIATLAYAAIAGDTGNFRWEFSPEIFRLSALLLERGASALEIVDKLEFCKSKTYLKMLAFAVENMEFSDELATIFLFLSYKKLQHAKIDEEKMSLVQTAYVEEIAKAVTGYPRGILIYEKRPGEIHINCRGNNFSNEINMPEVLAELGSNGGGHLNACGATVQGNFEEVKQKLLQALKKRLV